MCKHGRSTTEICEYCSFSRKKLQIKETLINSPLRKYNILANLTQETINYRSGTVNSKFHLIQSFCEYLARLLSFHV